MSDDSQSTPEDLYVRVAGYLTTVLSQVDEEDLSKESPCEDWTGLDVMAHLLGLHLMLLTAHETGETFEEVRPTPLPNELSTLERWKLTTDEVVIRLGDPDRSQALVRRRGSVAPFSEMVAGMLCSEVVIHSWDVARATGQDERLDREGVHRTFERMKQMEGSLRAPMRFGTPAQGDDQDDEDEQTALLRFAGRNP